MQFIEDMISEIFSQATSEEIWSFQVLHISCLYHVLKVRSQELLWEQIDRYIWNLHNFVTECTNVHNSLAGVHKKGIHIWTTAKMNF